MTDGPAVGLYQAFVAQDPAAAISVVESARSSGVAQDQLFDSLFAPALAMLGAAWAAGALDEVAFTQSAVIAEQIGSFVMPPAAAADTGVTVLVGSMHRDLHDVRKNVISSALREAGDRVVDLGVDVRPADFLDKAEETGARILIVCAETVATAEAVGRVREMFAASGRDEAVILVAGGPFDADPGLAKRVGANGVARGAEAAVAMVRRVMSDRFGGGV